jgi:hypothetical protein
MLLILFLLIILVMLGRGIGLIEFIVILLIMGMVFAGLTIQGHGIIWSGNNISFH